MNNNIYIDQYWGLFIGSFDNNQSHQHFAVQWSLALNDPIFIKDEFGKQAFQNSVLIKSNVIHQFQCSGNHLLLLFSPFSQIGFFLQHQNKAEIDEYNNNIGKNIQALGSKYLLNEIDFSDFVTKVKELLLKISTNYISSNLLEDDRIIKAIKYIEQNSNRVIPAQELAEHCHLSESRFLHLFKEKTSITYRQAQLWVKLSQSIPMLFKQKITDTAYEFGFSDSAHYSRVFKQNFGFSPKVFSKL